MANSEAPAKHDPYLTLPARLCKSVNALDADTAWQKYRDQLADMHAREDRENMRQQMAWGAYQQLLARNSALLRSMQKSEGGTVPPQAVQSACARGLKLVPEYGGDGLTDGAKARARAMADGQAVSDANIKRMKAFFARHTYEKTANPPSPGYVAYLLWGGAAGKAWANAQADKVCKGFVKGGEGSRGGRVIGHTKSNKPIYSASDSRYSGIAANAITGRTKAGKTGSGVAEQAMHVSQGQAAEPSYDADDHMDAKMAHKKEAMRHPVGSSERNLGNKVAQVHSASWFAAKYSKSVTKSAKPLGAAFAHAKKVAKKKGKAGNKKVMHAIAQRYLTANGHGKMGESK